MYTPAKERYETMEYNRCGESGLMLPKVSLGLWHNFGDTSDYENMKQLCFTAFDNGITQFDLANNYGPAYGSAERNFGKILKEELMPYRDELIIISEPECNFHRIRQFRIILLGKNIIIQDPVDRFLLTKQVPDFPP